eukprot:CAMPEP_0176357146 /NCGR_PEP_ID=MMETSP0126-20121128/14554_1 /TAXON_ID=141414 ORGANISM="Strombidinopsis acuminatum, Strain SPMC142" /NCGR_SAMPLE_ID=MMETSP0126 /ASSEMBLY_ACC=CAM_ASM_000229 /LENGTH=116 /DNA_ID=CAMNT_0017710607 /DNA_START=496 /DNA_END=846 /DNA_ORIENTATION=+
MNGPIEIPAKVNDNDSNDSVDFEVVIVKKKKVKSKSKSKTKNKTLNNTKNEDIDPEVVVNTEGNEANTISQKDLAISGVLSDSAVHGDKHKQYNNGIIEISSATVDEFDLRDNPEH